MKTIITICLLVLCAACSAPEPRSIAYGTDQCAACKMNIEDKRFAAQAVFTTGKQMVFDAPECMLGWYLGTNNEERSKVHTLYVTDYINPTSFIKANDAEYAVGDMWESPMGMNVAAFSSNESRDKQIQMHGGDPITYSALSQLAEEYR